MSDLWSWNDSLALLASVQVFSPPPPGLKLGHHHHHHSVVGAGWFPSLRTQPKRSKMKFVLHILTGRDRRE